MSTLQEITTRAKCDLVMVEHSIYLPLAVLDQQVSAASGIRGVSDAMEEFSRDFDDHMLNMLKKDLPWLEEAFQNAGGEDGDWDEDAFTDSIFDAIQAGSATGWLVQGKIPEGTSWGAAWMPWVFAQTFEEAMDKLFHLAKDYRRKKKGARA